MTEEELQSEKSMVRKCTKYAILLVYRIYIYTLCLMEMMSN